MRNYLIVIVGPTASGKTELAISVAESLKCEILNADSRQVFKEMNIGTAKPSIEQLKAIPHYFISSQSVTDVYSSGDYMKDALEKLEELFAKKNTAILVGGSGLYIKAVCEGLDEFPEVETEIREKLNAQYKEDGLEKLQHMLKELDPLSYENIDLQNPRRVIRALEVSISSGKPFSSFKKTKGDERNFTTIKIGIETERERLYERINVRADEMIKDGLVEEAKGLFPLKSYNALQTVGYQELFPYLEGVNNLETAINLIKQNSRRYAKRQMTWFRKDPEITWFTIDQLPEIMNFIHHKMESN